MSDARPVGNFKWTDEAVATLKRMVAEGTPYSVIGRTLGCSRSAAIGKFMRSGAPKPEKASTPLRAPKVARAQYQNASFNFKSPTVGPVSLRATPWTDQPEPAGKKTLVELMNHECRWGIGDPSSEGFRFCSEPVVNSAGGKPSSYCKAHFARVCAPKKKKPATPRQQARRRA